MLHRRQNSGRGLLYLYAGQRTKNAMKGTSGRSADHSRTPDRSVVHQDAVNHAAPHRDTLNRNAAHRDGVDRAAADRDVAVPVAEVLTQQVLLGIFAQVCTLWLLCRHIVHAGGPEALCERPFQRLRPLRTSLAAPDKGSISPALACSISLPIRTLRWGTL